MFTLVNINLLSFEVGPSVAAVGQIGASGGKITRESIKPLAVPWHPLIPGRSELFRFLTWHTRVSEFAGRDREMKELAQWAKADHPVWVKFLIADGGVGKSRLGAEFAEVLKKEDWSAGFVDLHKDYTFPLEKAGTLLVIDYPEERVDKVKELLHDLTYVTPPSPLRVLFLTRKPPEHWEEVIAGANAGNVVDLDPLTLSRLEPQDATTIFNTTATAALENLPEVPGAETGKALITSDKMVAWLKLAPENERALFVMAAAVHSAEDPDKEVVEYTGREVVTALARREVGRFQRMAEGRGLKEKFALARLLAMAAIAEELSLDDIKTIITDSKVPLGFQSDDDMHGELKTAGLLDEGRVRAPKPDILAAAFTVEVLAKRPDIAPETVWAALQKDIGGGLERLGRLCWDAEIVLGIHMPHLSDWLAQAVEGNSERSHILTGPFSQETRPQGWLKASVAVWRTLSDVFDAAEDRAASLNNLSNYLAAAGDTQGAVQTAKEAVDISRRLAAADPVHFDALPAACLNNLSNHLDDAGDTAEALAAIRESVEIYRRLAAASPARFEPDLAMSLNNLSNHLDAVGDPAGALKASKESVEIRRRLAAASPARYEPDLAMSLNNLSNRLYAVGDTTGALEAIKEAVEIYRRLAAASPARFEPDLARSLSISGDILSHLDRRSEAADAYREAVTLLGPYAEKWPDSPHEKLLRQAEKDLRSLEES